MESEKIARAVSVRIQINLLGGLRAFMDGEAAPLPPSKKTRALLGYLLLAPGAHTRSHLCDLLWDGPADPRAALRWSLSKLRPLIDHGERRLLADRSKVRLERQGIEIDLLEVEQELASSGEDVQALQALRGRFTGELLEGLDFTDCFAFVHWLSGERERVRNLRIGILSRLAVHTELTPLERAEAAREWIGLEPLDELAHARLIAARVAAGRPDSAREAAARCRELFARELGRAPGRVVEEACQTVNAAPAPLGPASAASTATELPAFGQLRSSRLFGRTQACEAIETHLEALVVGEPRGVLWFEGEPGIGKTRLLAEFAQRAEARGIGSRYAKAFEAESGWSLAVWSELLGPRPRLEGRVTQSEVFASLYADLEQLAHGAPLAVVLDDLQWIDEVSAAFLSWLARRDLPWLGLVATARSGEIDDNPAALHLRSGLAQEGRLSSVALGPLAAAEVRDLVESISAEADPTAVVQRTGGNPLFAVLLAEEAESRGTEELSHCIQTRLSRLAESDLEFLRVGAVVGGRFSLELVGEVAGFPAAALVSTLQRLEQAGVLRAGSGDEVDFVHDLLRQAVYESLSDPARRLYHKGVARVLGEKETLQGGSAARLARQAALAGEDELAARASVAAGREALALSSRDDARVHSRRAMQHAQRLQNPERRALRVASLWIEVHAGLGRVDSARVRAELVELSKQSEEHAEHETEREALYLLSVLDEEAGDFEQAQGWSLAAASAGRRGGGETRTRALANTGRCLAQLGRRLDEAATLLRQAAEGEERAPVDLPWGLGLLAWHAGELEGASRYLEEAYRMAETQGEDWAAFECLSRLTLVDLARGDARMALGRGEELERAAGALGGGSEQALAHALMALASYLSGSGGAREAARFDRGLDELRCQDSKAVLSTILNQAAESDRARGEVKCARKWAREALQNAQAVGRERQVAKARALLQDD